MNIAIENRITRVGVYGVATKDDKLLLIKQPKGPYAGKFDFPGGGIEFGESPEQTLAREFMEEVAMEFDSSFLYTNLTATLHVSATITSEPYLFFHIGMIYKITGCRSSTKQQKELQPFWIDPKILFQDNCSSLLWKYLTLKHT